MTRKVSWETRAMALGLLIEGWSVNRAAPQAGVSKTTLKTWATLAGMELVQGAVGGIVRSSAGSAADGGVGQYRRLTRDDRGFIQAALALDPPMTQAEIARGLGVNRSTVSREISAHGQHHWGQVHYDAAIAHHQGMSARVRAKPAKLDDPCLRTAVVERLNNKFSPRQVAEDLKKCFPHDKAMLVSHETIYQALYVQGKAGLRHELAVEKALRSGRTARRPQSKLPARTSRPWLAGAMITDRPAVVEDRAVPGHWEGDLVVGPANSGIITLVERSSRFVLLGRLPGARDSTTVTDVLATMIADLPERLRQSITWDQGSEMARHAEFTIATGCPVFFCDPHSPWQRGTNENTNGLIRDFYPKGTNFNTITDHDLAETARLLNIRPRQTLNWATPAEKLNAFINEVALAS